MDRYEARGLIRRTTCSLGPAAVGAAFLLMGMVIGSAISPPSTAWGEMRATPLPEHFQSGGQMSVPWLKDIATTLHQIDARLARLEAIAKQRQKQSE